VFYCCVDGNTYFLWRRILFKEKRILTCTVLYACSYVIVAAVDVMQVLKENIYMYQKFSTGK
jgi:hypothetical protein